MIDALRGYLRELRQAKSISQEELAGIMGIARRTLIDWEMGRTDDIKSIPLIRAASYLGASMDEIRYLLESDAGDEEGKRLALERSLSPVGTPQPQRDDLVRVMELAIRWKYDPRLSKLAAYGEKLLQEEK